MALLEGSDHHLGVELRLAGERIHAVGSFAAGDRVVEAAMSPSTNAEPV